MNNCSKELCFNGYEYLIIRRFTSMYYGKKCSLEDRISILNKNSIWHDLLSLISRENNFISIKIHINDMIIDNLTKALIESGDRVPSSSKQKISFPLPNDVYNLEMLKNYPHRLRTFLEIELNQYLRSINFPNSSPLSRYLERYNIVEVYLDNTLSEDDDSKLPNELFYCQNIKILSLKHNHLRQIPSAIGRLSKLEVLILTNNLLTVQSIPPSLKFCLNLKELYVDDNQFEALPGFLTSMDHLELVYRLGNRNYFKSMFLQFHTNYDQRVRKGVWRNFWARGVTGQKPTSLLDLCAEKIFSSGINFFKEEIPETLKHYMSLIYLSYNICNHCNIATVCSKPGYSTVTFQMPYLGNTCVPFQHWACSRECIVAIEGPAKKLQLEGAMRQDHEYSHYVAKSNKKDDNSNVSKRKRSLWCICK